MAITLLIPTCNKHTACTGVKGKQTGANLRAGFKLNLTFIVHNCTYVLATYVVQNIGTEAQVSYT